MIEFREASFSYPGKKAPALTRLSGQIKAGSLTAITGPNGGGKSTLLKALAGLLEPQQGQFVRPALRAFEIGYLSQAAEFDPQFPISIRDFVSLGRLAERGVFRQLTPSDQTQIDEALRIAGLEKQQNSTLDTLSGGQLQRARFARLAAQNAKLLLLDEPLSAVDSHTSQDLIQLIRSWNVAGKTILIVLHETSLVRDLCPETLLLATEAIAWGPTAAVLTPENRKRAQAITAGLPHSRQWHEVTT